MQLYETVPIYLISNKLSVFTHANKSISENEQTWYLHLDTNPKKWTPGPHLGQARSGLTCSLITDPSPQIVIVGGVTSTGFSNRVGILDLDKNSIMPGK